MLMPISELMPVNAIIAGQRQNGHNENYAIRYNNMCPYFFKEHIYANSTAW
jgi:hypothetical protein